MSIAKIGKTKTSGSAVDYIFKEKKTDEKKPEVVGGNVTGATKKEIKAEFSEQEKLNSKVKNTVTHFSVSFPIDKEISNADAADYADGLMEKMGYEKNPYIVVRHYDKDKRDNKPYAHIHIVASRINSDGSLISEWQNAERTIEAVKEIDEIFKLESIEYVHQTAEEKRERNIKKNEYQMMKRTGRLSILEEFKDTADSVLKTKINVQEFVKNIQEAGFEVLPNISETPDRMNGFSFAKDGIAFSAGRAGKQYKWFYLAEKICFQSERDIEFLQQLNAEVLAKKNLEKQEIKTQEIKINETTSKRIATKTLPIRVSAEENSLDKEAIGEMEKPPRIKSGSSLEKAEIIRSKSAPLRHSRDDDAANGSRKTTGRDAEKNKLTPSADEGKSSFVKAEISGRIDEIKPIEENSESGNQRTSVESGDNQSSGNQSRAIEIGNRSGADEGDERFQVVSEFNRENQSRESRGIEAAKSLDIGIPNSIERASSGTDSEITGRKLDNEKNNSELPGPNSRGERISHYGSRKTGEQSGYSHLSPDVFDSSADTAFVNSVLRNDDLRGFEPGIEKGASERGIYHQKFQPGDKGEGEFTDGLRPNNYYSEINLPANKRLFSIAARQAEENHSRSAEARGAKAKATAQIVNLQYFSAQLDPKILNEWTLIIEKSNADEFLKELIKPETESERQKVIDMLNRQVAIISEKLKLPKPDPTPEIEPDKLASAIIEIEVKNHEINSAQVVTTKAFEILASNKLNRADAPPSSLQIQTIRDIFTEENLPLSANIKNELEAGAIIALFRPELAQADAGQIDLIEEAVARNIAAARETATLIQIAYGGQGDKFTSQVKDDLEEKIYHYEDASPYDIYQDYRQLDWQKTIENFAPLVDNIAESYEIQITTPNDTVERNRLLSDFIIDTYTAAYKVENSAYQMRSEIAQQLLQATNSAAKMTVADFQSETIQKNMDENLEPPELSSALEASAYSVAKYDDDELKQKSEQVIMDVEEKTAKAEEIRLARKEAVMELEFD